MPKPLTTDEFWALFDKHGPTPEHRAEHQGRGRNENAPGTRLIKTPAPAAGWKALSQP